MQYYTETLWMLVSMLLLTGILFARARVMLLNTFSAEQKQQIHFILGIYLLVVITSASSLFAVTYLMDKV